MVALAQQLYLITASMPATMVPYFRLRSLRMLVFHAAPSAILAATLRVSLPRVN